MSGKKCLHFFFMPILSLMRDDFLFIFSSSYTSIIICVSYTTQKFSQTELGLLFPLLCVLGMNEEGCFISFNPIIEPTTSCQVLMKWVRLQSTYRSMYNSNNCEYWNVSKIMMTDDEWHLASSFSISHLFYIQSMSFMEKREN
jgi:hypothetical protein